MSQLAFYAERLRDAVIADCEFPYNNHIADDTQQVLLGTTFVDVNMPITEHGHTDTALTLAIRHTRDHDGYAPITRDNNHGNAPYLIDFLVRHGAYIGDPHAKDAPKGLENVPQPLAFAVKCGKQHVVLQLIELHAYLDAQGKDGKTALHEAVLKRDTVSITHLIKAGAKTDIADENGKTARDYADKKLARIMDKAQGVETPGKFAKFFENMGRAYEHGSPTITGWHIP